MPYTPQTWTDSPSTSTPITAARLTYMETGIQSAAAGAGALPLVAASNAPATVQNRADYVCDGTADQTEINTALALNAGGVILSGGLFTVSAPITILSNGQTLTGVGPGASGVGTAGEPYGKGTTIKVASGFSGTAVIRAAYTTGQAYSSNALQYATIANLAIDGNSRTGSGIDGIHFRSYQGSIDNVIVDQCSGNGIHINGYSGWSTYDSRFERLILARNGLAGFRFGAQADDCHLMNAVIFDNLGPGIEIDDAASEQITQVHCYSNDTHGIHLKNRGDRTKIVNSKIEGNGFNGLFLDGTTAMASGVQITGCNFGSNGSTTTNTYAHIRLDSGTSGGWGTTIVGNTFGNPYGSTNLCHSAIYLNSQPRYTLIEGNNFVDGTLGQVGAATAQVTITANPGNTHIVNNLGLRDRRQDFSGPTAAAGANAGTSPPAPVVVGGSNDQRGDITFGTGTTPAAGAQVVVTFATSNTNYGGNNPGIVLTARNSATQALGLYVSASSSTAFTVSSTSAPAASQANTVYRFHYVVLT